MKITVQSDGATLSRQEREQVQRRVLLALARFADRIRRVDVHWNSPQPEGGGELTVGAEVLGVGPLQATAVAEQLVQAVGLAADRLQRAVTRRLDNLQEGMGRAPSL